MVQIIVFVLVSLIAGIRAWPNNTYVVNGSDTTIAEYPYTVSVKRSGYFACGGSILDTMHILTAAHCLNSGGSSSYSIQYGSTDLLPESRSTLEVASFEIHPDYVPEGVPAYANDIAVLTLVSPIPLSKVAQPTVLPKQGTPTPDDFPKAILVGWGLNATSGTIMTTLQKAELMLYSDESCNGAHGDNVDSSLHVCAGVPEGGKGQCNGDAGGPIILEGVQRGLVSWSVKPCTVAPFPGVYVNLASYTDWICSQANCNIAAD